MKVPSIVNSKIVKVRLMTKAELDSEFWETPALVLELDTGVKLYASQDKEGNGSGVLFGTYKGDHFAPISETK